MKTALIGGASMGIGYACALGLAKQGNKLVLCARNEIELNKAAKKINEDTGAETIVIPCDLSKKECIAEMGKTLTKQGIGIDILINNIGGPKPGLVTELCNKDWENGLDLLFWSTLQLYELVLPGMREKKWGRIINILSTTAVEPAPNLAISSVLRAGLAVYTKLLSREIGRDGINIHNLMPGGIRTARTEQIWKDIAARDNVSVETLEANCAAKIPIGRMLEANDIGNLVAFLASESSSGLTGTLLPIDGGQMITV
jgi:3-oxoacyl-[acyl-carrier protein] reductase